MEDSKEELDEWRELMMSSKGIFEGNFGTENCGNKPIDEIFVGNFGCNDHEKDVENLSKFDMENAMLNVCEDELKTSMDVDNSGVIKSGVSIAERRAMKCGFNASKISTPWFRSSTVVSSSKGLCWPHAKLSPGTSPQALLDSPILLPNAQLSPTTGSFVSQRPDEDGQMLISAPPVGASKENEGGFPMFKPHSENSNLAYFHDADNQVSSTGGLAQSLVANIDCQSASSRHSLMGFEFPVRFCEEVGRGYHDAGSPHDKKISDDLVGNSDPSTFQPCDSSVVASLQMPHENGNFVGEDLGTHNSLDGNQNGSYPYAGTMRSAEDGYNWRKYGQKQVKGSEYPRSYYKCTQPNCQVTKKVERSHDGQITEIIYKGAHNHPQRQPCRKSALGSSSPFNETSDIGDNSGAYTKANGSSVWRNVQSGYKDVVGSDQRIEGLERTSSTSALTEGSDPLSNTQGKQMCGLESAGTPEFTSTLASNEDVAEDAATQGNYMIAHDCEIEPDSKRRKKDGCIPETTLGSRAVREPRVVVQIESEIDILDDGYRWRKYGQKVVKGNPNPRSYYKCTSSGCTVTKQVERSSQNKKFVITTYVGKHNHEVPAARNSSHAHSGNGSLPTAAATNTQTSLTLPRSSHLPKPEPSSRDLPLHFDTKMESNNDFLRAHFLDNRVPETPSFYPMRFPAMPNTTTPYNPFSHHPAYASNIVPTIPDLSFSLPLGYPRSISTYCNPERSHSSVQPLYAGHELQENDAKFLRPKQEVKDDSFFDNELHSIVQKKSSSVYNHVPENFQP